MVFCAAREASMKRQGPRRGSVRFGKRMVVLAQRIAHQRRGGKLESKLERYPPLDGAACPVPLRFSRAYSPSVPMPEETSVHPVFR